MIYRMQLADSVDEMTFDLLEVPIEDKDIEGTADNTTIDGNVFTDYLWLKKQFVQKWSLMCEDDYTQLRGFYTRQWENAEVPTYKLFVGENRSETLTASGSAFQIQNGTQYDAPLTLTELTGNATQNGTPTPDAPVAVNTTTGEQVVKIEGKNLGWTGWAQDFVQRINNTSWANITQKDGRDCLFFATRAGYNEYDTKYLFKTAFVENTPYTFSFDMFNNGDSVFSSLAFVYTDETSQVFSWPGMTANTWYHMVATSNANKTLKYVRCNWQGSNKYIDLNTFMVEQGLTASPYEPYVGQEFPINLGKNLFNADYYATATYTSETYKYTTTDFEGGKTYTFSATLKAGKTAISGAYVCISDAPNPNTTSNRMVVVNNGNPVPTGLTASFASNATIYFQFYPTTLDIEQVFDTYDFQLERGSSATAYAPYFPPIELAKIGTYQDRIYKTDGKWYIEKQVGKITYNGSEANWQVFQYSTNGYQFFRPIDVHHETNIITTKSNYFVGGTIGNRVDVQNTVYTYNGGLAFNPSGITTTGDWTTWLGSHPTTVYYALATPTTTEITDSTLLSQLNFIANLYGGTNNIMLVGTGAQGEIGVEYTLTYEREQVIIPETPVRLNLTDGGVINTCGCRQNVQLTMRETVQ